MQYIKRRDKERDNLMVLETATWISAEIIPEDAAYFRFPDIEPKD